MVGIVILNYKNYQETIECVDSITKTTKIDYTIFIVDNKSNNGSVEALEKHFANNDKIKIYEMPNNLGYAAGNNKGINEAIKLGCSSIVISNPDVLYYDEAIDKMILKLESLDDIGVIGPKVLCNDLSIQKYTRKPINYKRYLSRKKPFLYIMKKTLNDYEYTNYDYQEDLVFEGMVSGCCFAIKTEVAKTIGGFDENTFLFSEEDIIGFKLAKINKKACIAVDSVVIHKGSTTIGKKASAFSSYHRYVSSYYALVKYAKINKFQRMVVTIINLGSFFARSITNSDYRKMLKPIVKEYRNMKKRFNK